MAQRATAVSSISAADASHNAQSCRETTSGDWLRQGEPAYAPSGVSQAPPGQILLSNQRKGIGQRQSPSPTAISSMSQPENPSTTDCVSVSHADTGSKTLAAEGISPDTISGVDVQSHPQAVLSPTLGCVPLAVRAERALFQLDALHAIATAEVGPATGPARLIECRWEAARALLLEMLREADPGAPEQRQLSPEAEGALLRQLVQGPRWRWTEAGTLARVGGKNHA